MLKLVCMYMSTSVTWILKSDMKDLSFLQEKKILNIILCRKYNTYKVVLEKWLLFSKKKTNYRNDCCQNILWMIVLFEKYRKCSNVSMFGSAFGHVCIKAKWSEKETICALRSRKIKVVLHCLFVLFVCFSWIMAVCTNTVVDSCLKKGGGGSFLHLSPT